MAVDSPLQRPLLPWGNPFPSSAPFPLSAFPFEMLSHRRALSPTPLFYPHSSHGWCSGFGGYPGFGWDLTGHWCVFSCPPFYLPWVPALNFFFSARMSWVGNFSGVAESATGGVLKEFLARYGKVLDPEKEDKRLGKMHKESAASIVEDYELPLTAEEFSEQIMPMYQERWPQAKALPGANRLIRHLHKHGIPLALASNSIKKHIEIKISYQKGWKESFSVILGGDEVNHGKPSPDMFLDSARRMGVDASHCLVIEDSLVGVTAAKAAGMKVVAVPSLHGQADHFVAANCVLHSLLEFQPDLWGLPEFDDWIQNALPIEPLYVRGLLCTGAPHDSSILMEEFAGLIPLSFPSELRGPSSPLQENDSSISLPNQLSGVFFGWAKLGTRELFKVVMSIQWDNSSNSATSLIKPCIVSETCKHTFGKQLLLLIIGYIRKLNRENIKESPMTTLGVTEEDKNIAGAVLDLPMFADHKNDPFLAE